MFVALEGHLRLLRAEMEWWILFVCHQLQVRREVSILISKLIGKEILSSTLFFEAFSRLTVNDPRLNEIPALLNGFSNYLDVPICRRCSFCSLDVLRTESIKPQRLQGLFFH
jgi:hypothetical protein